MRQWLPNLLPRLPSTTCPWREAALVLLLIAPVVASAERAEKDAPEHSRAALRAEAAQMETVVRACAASASACDPRAVPADETIAADGAEPEFTLRWDWLAEAMQMARDGKPVKASDQVRVDAFRRDAMQTCLVRLQELGQQAGAAPTAAQQASFPAARRTADQVLSRVEFDKVAPPSWWDRQLARFWAWVGRLFNSVGKLGEHRPWVGRLLEFIFFLAAGAGLLAFLRRNFQRQRLAASLRVENAARTAWDREATDWAALAESAAALGEWRDAVHCLYWASIVRLESRRAWRHNPARTPREYVRLLKPGSVQRESLGGLTGLLERVWYGLRPAGAEEYSRARVWFDRLSETGGAFGSSPAAVASAGGGESGSVSA